MGSGLEQFSSVKCVRRGRTWCSAFIFFTPGSRNPFPAVLASNPDFRPFSRVLVSWEVVKLSWETISQDSLVVSHDTSVASLDSSLVSLNSFLISQDRPIVSLSWEMSSQDTTLVSHHTLPIPQDTGMVHLSRGIMGLSLPIASLWCGPICLFWGNISPFSRRRRLAFPFHNRSFNFAPWR